MKTFFFHLMPYADLDLSYTDRYNSAWVTLPNSYFDPKIGEKLYQRYIGELELADQLGFDGICVNEHHQTAYGLMPAPNLIAAALARTTKQAKIAILGRALPLVNNPVALAEEFAMLDHLSGGRIITGFVRGIGTEYFAERRQSDPLARALLRGARADPAGLDRDRAVPLPRQALPVRLRQPLAAAVAAAASAGLDSLAGQFRNRRVVRVGEAQVHLPADLQPDQIRPEGVRPLPRRWPKREGYESQPSQLGWAVPTYVAETDEIARRELKPHIEAFFNKFLHYPLEMRMPPGYSSIASTKSLMREQVRLPHRWR